MRRCSTDFPVLVIIDTLDRQELRPFKVSFRPQIADDQCDWQGVQERGDVTVEAGQCLSEGLDGRIAE